MRRIAWLAAIVVGAASLALFAQHKKNFEERVGGGDKVAVLVAAADVALGDILSEDMLVTREIPENYVDARHIPSSDVARIIGIRASVGLRAGESILWTDLAAASDERRVLSNLVQSGMRAITVRTEYGATLGGLLRPGDRVDLLLRGERGNEAMVTPLLQNVLVLAVGNDLGTHDSNNVLNAMMSGSTLTLSVTVDQAQALTLAQGEGSLSVSLRNPDDIVVQRDAPVTTTADIHLAEKRAALQQRHIADLPVLTTREIEHVE